MRFVAKVLGNSFGILLSSILVPGIAFSGNLATLIITGLIYSIIHAVLRPILKLLTGPFILLTLGLFTFVIQIFLLWLTDAAVPFLDISSLGSLIWGTLIIGAINLFI